MSLRQLFSGVSPMTDWIKPRHLLFFFLLALVMVAGLYRHGGLLVGGEEGNSLFNYVSVAAQISPWQTAGLGYSHPLFLGSLITKSAINFLLKLGVGLIVIQQLFYLFIFLGGLTGAYLLVRRLVAPKFLSQSQVSLVLALFYLFNLYVVSQVFARFLYASMVSWAMLPWFLLLWILWTGSGRFRYLLFWLGVCLVYSQILTSPGYMLTNFFLVFVWSLVDLLGILHRRAELLALVSRMAIALLAWSAVFFWWLWPVISTYKSSYTSISQIQSTIGILKGLSTYFTPGNLLYLRQQYLFTNPESYLSVFYSTSLDKLESLVIFLVFCGGVLFLIRSRIKYRFHILAIGLVTFFICKGTNPPLGDFLFSSVFSSLGFLDLFRNVYEKFGLAWMLSYVLIFGFGLGWLLDHVPFRRLFSVFIIFLVIHLSWPLLTGDVFPAYRSVTFPVAYTQINQLLNSDPVSGRLLLLPLDTGESVRYQWGFWTVDTSEFIFDRPSVSHPVYFVQPSRDKLQELYTAFTNRGDYASLLDQMGIKYLLVRRDIDSVWAEASPSAQVISTLAANPRMNLLRSVGDLDLYTYTSPAAAQEIVTAGSPSPQIQVHQFGRLHYRVRITHADSPFELIFKSTYNPNWQASINGTLVTTHTTAYGYANAWHINRSGDFSVDIYFAVWPWDHLL